MIDIIMDGIGYGTVYMLFVAVIARFFFEQLLPPSPLVLLVIFVVCMIFGIITSNRKYKNHLKEE